jgi:hypothetical protein
MDIETILRDEIRDEFDEMSKIQIGSDEYKTTVDGLTKLMDRAIEIDKINTDAEMKEAEAELKSKQMDDERKDRKVRNCIAIAGIVIPTTITIWGTLKTLKFEEVGTVTTIAGRNFMNQIFKR